MNRYLSSRPALPALPGLGIVRSSGDWSYTSGMGLEAAREAWSRYRVTVKGELRRLRYERSEAGLARNRAAQKRRRDLLRLVRALLCS